MARPTKFTLVLADQICERLADGESLRSICLSDTMPGKATVFRWLRSHEKFRDQYVRAREAQADALFDEILDIADEECTTVKADKHPRAQADDNGMVEVVFDNVAVQRNRLRIDARKWMAGKLRPKVYGDKPEESSGKDDAVTKIEIEVVNGKIIANDDDSAATGDIPEQG